MKKLDDAQRKIIWKKIKINNDKFLILLNYMGAQGVSFEVKNHNVFCVNSKEEILWQIKLDEDPLKNANAERGNPFVYLEVNEKGEYSATNFNGFEYIIDINTGDATLIAWHK